MTPDQKPPVIEESQRVAIRYSLTRWDLIRWNVHLTNRNWIAWGWLFIPSFFLIRSILNAPEIAERPFVIKVFSCVVLATVILISYWFLVLVAIGLTVCLKRFQGLLGEHELEITDEGLIERTSLNETLNRWAGFHKVVKTRKYLIIYVTDVLVHIIPRRCFPSGRELKDFEAALQKHLRHSKG